LDGSTLRPGTEFHFDVHLFQIRDPEISCFVQALGEFGHEGFGPRRLRAELIAVDQLDISGAAIQRLFDGTNLYGNGGIVASQLSLDSLEIDVRRVELRFSTPTELKHENQVTLRPEFGVLMSRIRDRLSTLGQLYGDGPLHIDFAEFGRRAGRVLMTRCEVEWVDVQRVSARTGQRHSLGGIVGLARYEGELAEFLPFLHAAQFTGVGRQTTWGKGELHVVSQAPGHGGCPGLQS
jgi:hypothetical protein